jgi:nucleoside-diphosphate-sugar epimerase
MTKQPTIVVTGTAGFIGAVFVQYLNEQGLNHLNISGRFWGRSKKK